MLVKSFHGKSLNIYLHTDRIPAFVLTLTPLHIWNFTCRRREGCSSNSVIWVCGDCSPRDTEIGCFSANCLKVTDV